MSQTFGKFITTNFTITVFVSVIVYKMFSIFLDEVVTPCFNMFVDPDSNFPNKKLKFGMYTLEYGKSFRELVVLLLILILTYFLFKTK